VGSSAILPLVNSRLVAIALLASAACDAKKSDGIPSAPLAASNVAAALGVDADLPPPPDPAAAPGDLAADVAAFTTLDACVASHAAKMDPLIADALLSFGYDTFVRDACRQIDAAKSQDARKCDAIVASELADHCRATIAMIAGKPDDCPFSDSSKSNGRVPTCIAAALRDPRFCISENAERRPACNALVTHDPTQCDVVPKPQIAQCRRAGDRLASSLPPAQSNLAALPKASSKLDLTALAGTQTLVPRSSTLQSDVETGVAISIGAVETVFSFGPSHEEAAFPHEVTPSSPVRIGFDMHVANAAKQETKIKNVVLEVPGGVRLDDAQMHTSPKIKILQLEKNRGGAVEFTVDGEIGSSPQAFAFHLEVKTFVRDVVKPL
jgi:hypothetical protein